MGDDGVASNIVATETKVVGAQRTVNADDITEVVDDALVIADLVTGRTSEVVTEAAKASMELFKHNGLTLDFTDLFRDDPLSHLLEDN